MEKMEYSNFEDTEFEQKEEKEYVLLASAILRYLIGKDDEIETLIMCKGSELKIVTSDKALYEALGSIKPQDEFKLPKLVKLFEVTQIQTAKDKPILTDERVEELRKAALKDTSINKKENAKDNNQKMQRNGGKNNVRNKRN
jgi:hypothetical protein